MLKKIISGGQTGADRAALDWAIAHGIAHGGWCPRERMELFRLTRKCAQSIAELAVASRRDRSAVARDVSQLEGLGLVRVVDQPNPGHGRKKVVEPVARHIEVVTEF